MFSFQCPLWFARRSYSTDEFDLYCFVYFNRKSNIIPAEISMSTSFRKFSSNHFVCCFVKWYIRLSLSGASMWIGKIVHYRAINDKLYFVSLSIAIASVISHIKSIGNLNRHQIFDVVSVCYMRWFGICLWCGLFASKWSSKSKICFTFVLFSNFISFYSFFSSIKETENRRNFAFFKKKISKYKSEITEMCIK